MGSARVLTFGPGQEKPMHDVPDHFQLGTMNFEYQIMCCQNAVCDQTTMFNIFKSIDCI